MPTRRQFIMMTCPLLAAARLNAASISASASAASSAASASTASSASATASNKGTCTWPAWENFRKRFMQADGRIIDFAANGHSTSEGQAYGMFFALVANDRPSFDLILQWAKANLAGGDLTARLMSWHWGKKADGGWGVLDSNPASDADVWMAYTLHQAGHIWQDAQFTAIAKLLQARIERELIIMLPSIGPVLLPAPEGFALKSGGWRLNPSYLPLQVLAGLQRESAQGPWGGLMQNTLKMIDATTPQFLVSDWVAYRPQQGFILDKEAGLTGSFDAIRTYLWAGMLSKQEPMRNKLLARMKGMQALVEKNGVPPQKIDTSNGALIEAAGPLGFSAALLPFLAANSAQQALDQQRSRIVAGGGLPAIYYEQALGLFALGFLEQRYHFARDGKLMLPKQAVCTT
jgi:endoglucanase